VKLTDRLLLQLVPPLGASLIRVIEKSMVIERVDEPHWEKEYPEKEGVIFAFWHNRLLLIPYASRGRKGVALISRHRDGELISRTVPRFGLESVRGSTTRGGREALRRLPDLLRAGYDVGITPDGPTGPPYKVQPGAVQLARLSGRPVIPVIFASSRPRVFNSWDRFQVPRLFSKGVFLWGPALWIGPDDDVEEKRLVLEKNMIALTARADGRFTAAGEGGRSARSGSGPS
jgi:lysophospholipid acyltransferase (LPLAT)-like uncharacterized protein